MMADAIAIGERNVEIIELARRHCLNMQFRNGPGFGYAEEMTGLPINSRSIHCDFASGPRSEAMRLDWIAQSFYEEHCIGCAHRRSTDQLPNLASWAEGNIAERRADQERLEAERRNLRASWEKRRADRRALSVQTTLAMATTLEMIDTVDFDPTQESDRSSTQDAIDRLSKLAQRAPEQFTLAIIDHIIDLVEAVPETRSLLIPLRYIGAHHASRSRRVAELAILVLGKFADPDAGRCVIQLREYIQPADFSAEVCRNLVRMAGAKAYNAFGQQLRHGTSGEIEPLRIAATANPTTCSETIAEMLGSGVQSAPALILPHAVQSAIRKAGDLGYERAAAAISVRRLSATHLEFAVNLFDGLIRALGSPDGSAHDSHPRSEAQQAVAALVVRSPERLQLLLETVLEDADSNLREALFGVVDDVINLCDPEYRFRQAEDPTVTEVERASLLDWAANTILSTLSEGFGSDLAVEASDSLKNLASQEPAVANKHLAGILGTLIRACHALDTQPQASRLQVAQASESMRALEVVSYRHTVAAVIVRLLDVIVSAASLKPAEAVADVVGVLSQQIAENDASEEVRWRLVKLLGELGRAHGESAGVLPQILPALYTHTLGSSVLLRAQALDAWVEIASKHVTPSSISDILPALVEDSYVLVINSLLRAGTRLKWSRPDQRMIFELALTIIANPREAPDDKTLLNACQTAIWLSPDPFRDSVLALAATAADFLNNYDVEKVLRAMPKVVTADLALAKITQLRLRMFRDAAINDRINAGFSSEPLDLIESRSGLSSLPSADLVDSGVEYWPDYPLASMEVVEIALYAGRTKEALTIIERCLEATPDVPAYATYRSLISPLKWAIQLDDAAVAPHAWEQLGRSLVALQSEMDARDGQLASLPRRVALVALGKQVLKNSPVTDDLATVCGLQLSAESRGTSGESSRLNAKIADLRALSENLEAAHTAMHTPTSELNHWFARSLDVAATLVQADASELDGNAEQFNIAMRGAKRAASNMSELLAETPSPVEPVQRLQSWLASVQGVTDGEQAAEAVRALAEISIPPAVIEGSSVRPRPVAQGSAPSRRPVVVTLASIDDELLLGPAVLQPGTVYTLSIEVRLDAWPEWATQLDIELRSHLTPDEVLVPSFSLPRPSSDPDEENPAVLRGSGTLLLRFRLPAGRPAPPFALAGVFRSADRVEPCDLTGHREIRLRPFDATRDRLTDHAVVDERLLGIMEKLYSAGYPENELQAFGRLLTSICRAAIVIMWSKQFKRGQRVTERIFHDRIHELLVADPVLEGRVDRGDPLALGYLDVRHDGITAELKVERQTAVSRDRAHKYMGQPTQYAAADGAHLSILCVLDMSPKEVPIGTIENYLWTMQPSLHGLTNPEAPSLVATLVVNGNSPVPSSWSRRKTPEVYEQED